MCYTLHRETIQLKRGDDMFNIKFVDIAGDGLVVDCETHLETLAEVEIMAKNAINEHLHITTVELVYDDELVYSVWVNGREIGLVVVKDVNEPSHKRK